MFVRKEKVEKQKDYRRICFFKIKSCVSQKNRLGILLYLNYGSVSNALLRK